MTPLWKQIEQLRPESAGQNLEFIPSKLLYSLLTTEVVSGAVDNCDSIPPYRRNETVERIIKGGRRLFAILVLLKGKEGLIVNFIEHDQFQRSSLDLRLPLPINILENTVPEIASNFYDMQWQLLSPIFSKNTIHRSLHDRIRLPFVYEKEIGSGGFGTVYEVVIHSSHQKLPTDQRIVRKEFRHIHDERGKYEAELHNLGLLNELKHPNIVELISSYTYKGKHNFLFPLASDGDLNVLLTQEQRPSLFESDEVFFLALSQLSSAIEMMHNYTLDKLDLRLIGCHRDLKPKNILVHGNTFILADFGISSFKEISESSKTTFKLGEGHYLAPECEDYESQFEKHLISRPSDIWSYGCIILEVITYMLKGKGGVSEFKRRRKFKVRNFTTFTFHAGINNPHPEVIKWISYLESQASPSGGMLIQLVKSMLAMNPEDRPKAMYISLRMTFIAANAYVSALKSKYSTLLQTTNSLEADIESKRFESWSWAVEAANEDQNHKDEAFYLQLQFASILECLVSAQEEIDVVLENYNHALVPQFRGLRCVNDRLWEILPGEVREQAQTHLELCLIQSEDVNVLEERQNLFERNSLHEKINMLATVKRMTILVLERSETCRPELEIGSDRLRSFKSFEDHSEAMMKNAHQTADTRVLVEWIRYDTHWEGPISQEMLVRVEAIANILSDASKPDDFRVLHCSGYFHDPNKYAFGLVYDFPASSSDAGRQHSSKMRSLKDVISITKDFRARPPLEDRFKLAYALAVSILEFHKVGWMHKSISAYNVVFFHQPDPKPIDWLLNPRIIGFNHSRPDEPQAFTEGPPLPSKYQRYHHPRYTAAVRFRPDFDYFSLGVVLLEIGRWQTLDDMTLGAKQPMSQTDLRDELVQHHLPHLGHAMGTSYRDAVAPCLAVDGLCGVATDGGDWTPEMALTVHLGFERLVIERLGKWSS